MTRTKGWRIRRAARLFACAAWAISAAAAVAEVPFRLDQILGYPFPSGLVAAATGSRIAWVLDERGVRNIWGASGPGFRPHRLTPYATDDGQALSELELSPDGRWVVYVRGGEHHGNWPAPGGLHPNPAHLPSEPKVEIWVVPFGGGEPRRLAEGDEPVVSPDGDRVAFVREHQVWVVPLDGAEPPRRLFFDRGRCGELRWSPDGSRLAFVSDRGDHAFVGVYSDPDTPLLYLAPSIARDGLPRWSPDGARLAFVRRSGAGGAPQPLLEDLPEPWEIWTADVTSGRGRRIWRSPETLAGSDPDEDDEAVLEWSADARLLFLSEHDGWPHLYSLSAEGGEPRPLTPGRFMVEFVALSRDRRSVVYSANSGDDPADDDRRHLFRVKLDGGAPIELTSGEGLEWAPQPTGDGKSLALLASGPRRPPGPAVMDFAGGPVRRIGDDRLRADFPSGELVVPQRVVFRAPDGRSIHGQLFAAPGAGKGRPGVLFVHGGPSRQMLLGWHYMDYYANSYAVNQLLASRGFLVLSVNYRLGIGYGHDFHHPAHAGPWGAAEYQDVLAGLAYLARDPRLDARRVGIWGGSYGGYLTALALARDSRLFAAGVDWHGVHDWLSDVGGDYLGMRDRLARYERGDAARAREVAWGSSPVSAIDEWRSPVLLVQGDDDRNVSFHQTVDLGRRLAAADVPHEVLVIPDEVHGFLRYASWLAADGATIEFLERHLGAASATGGSPP